MAGSPAPAASADKQARDMAAGAPSVTGQEKRERMSRLGQQKKRFAEMERVSIRVDQDTRVQINGYPFKIKGKTRVMVPAIVAEVLEQAGRI